MVGLKNLVITIERKKGKNPFAEGSMSFSRTNTMPDSIMIKFNDRYYTYYATNARNPLP